ncbi:uncharacterized protein I303_107134 [Kwoniella dejecticola CBS 10117]|uniref:Uncharacterized protein n=1 Tax=Kwoniella dejecticola CBS 10117 TaxID=1296121 RepID=A0A1A5ZYU8_9TREE|nr:uncharacterized protein I303_06536 [Kwoniella dejecticola CBS 10117]OBR82978.1 hypothetical protein I303_06536 [Kwoniella dejecticola CBS 10117]
MTASLLDLNDDTLQMIGLYVHGDTDIPIPSFNPHWANFADEIDPNVQNDYINFRSTCRRLSALMPLRGLHLILRSWNDLIRWKEYAPDIVKRAVRRLIIDIDTSLQSETPKDIWQTFATLLPSFEALEEVVIKRSPTCLHSASGWALSLHHQPSLPRIQLQKLTSISLEMKCSQCAEELSLQLTSASTCIRAIKTTYEVAEEPNSRNILGQMVTSNPCIAGSLTALYLKIDDEKCGNQVLAKIRRSLPGLQILHMSSYTDERSGECLMGPYSLFGSATSTLDPEWSFKMADEGYNRSFQPVGSIDMWPTKECWDRFLSILGKFNHIRYVDCLINVLLEYPSDITPHRSRNQKSSSYDKALCRILEARPLDACQKRPIHRSALVAAAQIMLEHAPTLEAGAFWDHHLRDEDECRCHERSPSCTYRYNWRRVMLEEGKYGILFEDSPECFHDDFLSG